MALGERDPDSIDFYAGPENLVANDRRNPPSLQTIKTEAGALRQRLSAALSTEADATRSGRTKHIIDNLGAIETRVDLLRGARLSFDEESNRFFGLSPPPVDEERLNAIRAQIAERVGHGGKLVDRYAEFTARFIVPPDRVAAVIDAALQECRRRTLAHVRMPAGETVSIAFVSNQPWSAFSRYRGQFRSVIEVNRDYRFSVDQLLQLACHEGYPGHHTRNVLLNSAPSSSDWPERWVQLTFSKASLLSEAAAMRACETAFADDERTIFERQRLMPLAGLAGLDIERHVAVEKLVGDLQIVQADVARRYLNGELEFARAAVALEERALVPHGEILLKYINEYRTYITTYTVGSSVLRDRLAACAGQNPTVEQRWRCFRDASIQPGV